MTTVAYRDGIMVGDGRLCADTHILTDRYVKVRDCGKFIVGLAGNADCFEAVWDWYCAGCKGKSKPKGSYETLAFEKATGKLHTYEIKSKTCVYLPTDEPAAIGAGADYARVAMGCGKTALEAIKLAERFNSDTGGNPTIVVCTQTVKKKARTK